MPWFIVGFLAVLAVRSFGLIPAGLLPPIKMAANLLTTISMAALGLGVDVRVVAQAGVRVTAAVTLSLVVLGGISLGLIRLLGVGVTANTRVHIGERNTDDARITRRIRPARGSWADSVRPPWPAPCAASGPPGPRRHGDAAAAGRPGMRGR